MMKIDNLLKQWDENLEIGSSVKKKQIKESIKKEDITFPL